MRKINKQIVHHTASEQDTVESIRQFHRKTRRWQDIGYHYLINNGKGAPDGHISIGRPLEKVGAGVKNRNSGCIHICLVGDLTRHPPTRKQWHALGHSLLTNGVRFHLDYTDNLGHGEHALPGSGTACPGDIDMRQVRLWYQANISLARDSRPVESLADWMERHA